MVLTEREIILCMAALECCAQDLREGAAASKRLGRPVTPTMEKQADEMEALRKKILETTTG